MLSEVKCMQQRHRMHSVRKANRGTVEAGQPCGACSNDFRHFNLNLICQESGQVECGCKTESFRTKTEEGKIFQLGGT